MLSLVYIPVSRLEVICELTYHEIHIPKRCEWYHSSSTFLKYNYYDNLKYKFHPLLNTKFWKKSNFKIYYPPARSKKYLICSRKKSFLKHCAVVKTNQLWCCNRTETG